MRFDRTKLVGGKMQSLVLNDPGNPVEGNIGVRDFQLLVGKNSEFVEQALLHDPSFLYSFTEFEFTSPVVGATGPTRAQCLSQPHYASAEWAANIEFFNVVNGIQKWTVPRTGIYRAHLVGGASSAMAAGTITARVLLHKGTVVSILVVQGPKVTWTTGGPHTPNQCGSGGTFFVIGTTPILIAGGCGGTHTAVDEPNAAVLAPVSAPPNGGTGGRNQKSEYGGGGGFQTNGGGPGLIGGRSFLNGGRGGEVAASIDNLKLYGGFGGGGAGLGDTAQRSSLGGGGGYTGGDGIGYNLYDGRRYGNPGTSYAHPDLTPTIGRTAVYPRDDNSVHNGRCVVTFLEPR